MEKKARIYLRATPEQKREFKLRARASGLTLTEWLLKQCLEKITLPVEKNDE